MEVLKTNRTFFECLGFRILRGEKNHRKQQLKALFGIISAVNVGLGCFASLCYVIKFATIDLERALYGVFPFAALLCTEITFITTFMLRSKLSAIFLNFQAICDQSNNIVILNI